MNFSFVLPFCLSVYLSVCLSICLSVYLSLYLSLSVSCSIYLFLSSVCLFSFEIKSLTGGRSDLSNLLNLSVISIWNYIEIMNFLLFIIIHSWILFLFMHFSIPFSFVFFSMFNIVYSQFYSYCVCHRLLLQNTKTSRGAPRNLSRPKI